MTYHFHCCETTVYYKVEMGKVLFQTKNPIILEGRNCTIIFGREAIQQTFTCMYNKLFDTANSRNNGNEVVNVLILI